LLRSYPALAVRKRRAGAHKLQATISLDLDDLWTYLRARGDEGWASAPSVLQPTAERLIPLLEDLRLRITIFVVGRDAVLTNSQEVIKSFARAGHEIGNHSFDHLPSLPHLDRQSIVRDVHNAGEAIRSACGTRPMGFRSPAYGISEELIRVLVDAGYAYDASLFPTVLVPVLRLYHRAVLSTRARVALGHSPSYGRSRNAFLPLAPFRWRSSAGHIVELPVTTLPFLRVPIHMSYLQALAALSPLVAQRYLTAAIRLCQASNISLSFVLHPLDVLDAIDAPHMAAFPAMSMKAKAKVEQVRWSLDALKTEFEPRTLREFVSSLGKRLDERPLEGPRLSCLRDKATHHS
jgi:peptidoglycan/xylan/chitin deacetylase (PgdA/CDA1 family)